MSVTLRYCIKTSKRRITQTTPHDSPETAVFSNQINNRDFFNFYAEYLTQKHKFNQV